MTVQVPFRLRQLPQAEPAVALLLPTPDVSFALQCCARLALDPSGRLFEVSGGFLLELASPSSEMFAGMVRLRALAPALYVPVDAELVPSLLDDETTGLVRDWGLVFLPEGRTLIYDRQAPVRLESVVSAPMVARRSWCALPAPPRLADKIARISLEPPEQPPDALYRQFRQSLDPTRTAHGGLPPDGDKTELDSAQSPTMADDAAQPEAVGPAAGVREALAGAAKSLRMMFARAGEAFTRIPEKARWDWVDHSALLKKLVREFREGDPNTALRRAIPITDPDEPVAPVRARYLPWSRAVYNLRELLNRPGRGEATPVLPAQIGVIRALAREYRKAAEQAERVGDFRRAAYIYGVLLHDDRMAARALERGGLHHDAATLYLKKLGDTASAAQAFEAAGEIDRAISLYRSLGRHEAAGDLLRRHGDLAGAMLEYERAAALLVATPPGDPLAAGLLWLEKAGRPDRALQEFQAGWDLRPQGNALVCALEMMRIHAQRGSVEPIRAILDQADALFETFNKTFDGYLYTEVARLALMPSLAHAADELRDRVLLSLVQKLRTDAGSGQSASAAVSALFGRSKLWPPALVSDAEFAATALMNRARARPETARRDPRVAGVRIGRGVVVAACQSTVTSEFFLGFDCGEVLVYRPYRDEVVKVAEDIGPLIALQSDPEGTTVVAIHRTEGRVFLSCFRKLPDGTFRSRLKTLLASSPHCWLTPVLTWGAERLVGFYGGQDLAIVDAASGMLWQWRKISRGGHVPPTSGVLLPIGAQKRPTLFANAGDKWVAYDGENKRLPATGYQWCPGVPPSSSIKSPTISSRFAPPLLEIAGLDENGAVFAARFHADEESIELLSSQVTTTNGGYRAAALASPGMVVAVSADRVDWLDAAGDRFRTVGKLDLAIPSAVACFAIQSTQETLVVCSDGFVTRISGRRRIAKVR